MNFFKQNLKKTIFYPVLLISLLPFSLIFGNFLLNFNIILIILFGIYFFFISKKNFFFNFKDYIFVFAFFTYILLNSLIFHQLGQATLKSFFYLKFLFLIFLIPYFLRENKSYFFMFLISIFICCLLLVLDGSYQHFTGKNIFGWKLVNGRTTSLFKDEAVVGSYLSKMCFYVVAFMTSIKLYKNYSQYLILLMISFFIFAIIFSGERMAFLHSILGIFLFFSFLIFKKNFKIFHFLLIIFVIFSALNNEYFKSRVSETFKTQYGIGNSIEDFKDSQWGAHYLVSMKIIKNNLIFGSGLKSFRKECSKYPDIESKSADSRCSTHPHNYVLEILSEIGLIGLVLFILMIYKVYSKIELYLENNFIYIIPSIIFLWPIGTSGSIFSTFNGSFFCINMAIAVLIREKKFKC